MKHVLFAISLILSMTLLSSVSQAPEIIEVVTEVECPYYLEKELEYEVLASKPVGSPIDSCKLNRPLRMMSGFGWRLHPILHTYKFHKGLDLSCPRGTGVKVTGYGMVERVDTSAGYGYNVTVRHANYQTRYAHLNKIFVEEGEKVAYKQIIGTVGETGLATNPHLHYEVIQDGIPQDPNNYLN
jgi:murein DD-endopeptidase MepM/ murein hydrolase activator NlpD